MGYQVKSLIYTLVYNSKGKNFKWQSPHKEKQPWEATGPSYYQSGKLLLRNKRVIRPYNTTRHLILFLYFINLGGKKHLSV